MPGQLVVWNRTSAAVLLGAVQHGDALDRLGQRRQQVLGGPGAVQVHLHLHLQSESWLTKISS
jgi:hypothetical protein